jgi:hypothetical protein
MAVLRIAKFIIDPIIFDVNKNEILYLVQKALIWYLLFQLLFITRNTWLIYRLTEQFFSHFLNV